MNTNSLFGVKQGPAVPRTESGKRAWGWYFVLGIVLIIAGCVGLAAPTVATIASVIAYGWLIFVGGILETAAAIQSRGAPGFLLRLLTGILALVVGGLMVSRPEAGALTLTLLLAGFFLIGGIFRAATSVAFRLPGWGWNVVSGGITTLLGIMVWAQWPVSGLWVVGTFVAIEFLIHGWSWVMFGLAEREHPTPQLPLAA